MLGTRSGAAALLVALVACTENGALDRDSDGLGYTGDYGIETVERSCTPGAADTWRVDVRTVGWAQAIDLLIYASGAPDAAETHPLTNVAFDPGGEWDEWGISLLEASTETDAQAGETTAWGCEDAADLAWQVVMYAPDETDVPADCAVWGAQASNALAGPADVACTCVDDDADCS